MAGKKQQREGPNMSVALIGRLRARGADGAHTLQGSIVGLVNPIDARGEPGGGGAARRQHPRWQKCRNFDVACEM